MRHGHMRYGLRTWLVLALSLPILAGCPLPFGDPVCTWRPVAEAYVDANANGVRDPGETALEGVRIAAERVFSSDSPARSATYYSATSTDGAELNTAGVGSCPESMKVRAQAPASYTFTTAERVELRPTVETVVFGLQRSPETAFGTPSPQGEMTCYGGPALEGDVNGIALTRAGDLWTSRPSSERMFSVVSGDASVAGRTHAYLRAPGVSAAYDVLAASDGTIWAGGGIDGGVLRYEASGSGTGGGGWKWFTTADGLPADDAFQMEEAGGRVWTITWDGPASFDPSTQRWTTYPELSKTFRMLHGANGSQWFVDSKTLYQVAADRPGAVIARRTPVSAGLPDALVVDAVSTPDGDIWLAVDLKGERSLLRYSPASNAWTNYSFESTAGVMPADEIRSLRVLPDGSIFLSGQSKAPFRFLPGAAVDPMGGTWMNYLGQADATLSGNLKPLPDLSLAPQLVPVMSEDGQQRLCRVW